MVDWKLAVPVWRSEQSSCRSAIRRCSPNCYCACDNFRARGSINLHLSRLLSFANLQCGKLHRIVGRRQHQPSLSRQRPPRHMVRENAMPLRNAIHGSARQQRLSHNPRLHLIPPLPVPAHRPSTGRTSKLIITTLQRQSAHYLEGGVQNALTKGSGQI